MTGATVTVLDVRMVCASCGDRDVVAFGAIDEWTNRHAAPTAVEMLAEVDDGLPPEWYDC